MTGYSQSPKILKGALIVLDSAGLVGFIPRAIPFQYNPEKLGRTLQPFVAARDADEDSGDSDTRAQPFDPQEKISITLNLDASDALESPDDHPISATFGLAGYLAQLEQLLYPVGENFIAGGDLLSAASSAISGQPLPRPSAPVVLLFWGPGRILPVRITSYSVNETAHTPLLHPLQAEVTLNLTVLTPEQLGVPRGGGETTATLMEGIAAAAYLMTMAQKEVLAIASAVEETASIISGLG